MATSPNDRHRAALFPVGGSVAHAYILVNRSSEEDDLLKLSVQRSAMGCLRRDEPPEAQSVCAKVLLRDNLRVAIDRSSHPSRRTLTITVN